jgi:anti-anti-sigma regulatory factor
MNSVIHIKLANEFDKILNSRELATEVANQIRNSNANQAELDFSEVEFMSRSFADQFFKEKLKLLQVHNILIEVKNANEEITAMLKAVANTQNVTDRKISTINILHLDDFTALKNHLWNF